jgi:hypothetical protein
MKIKVGTNKYLIIKANKVSDKMRYVNSVKLNGKPYVKAYINYDDIKEGVESVFEMSFGPNKKRLFNEDEKPYSLSEYNRRCIKSLFFHSLLCKKTFFISCVWKSQIFHVLLPRRNGYHLKMFFLS